VVCSSYLLLGGRVAQGFLVVLLTHLSSDTKREGEIALRISRTGHSSAVDAAEPRE